MQILKEEIAKPTVTKDDILAYLIKYRKLNMKQLDHRRRLIDSFVNAIYLFDDYLVITFNYKEGTKRVTFAEIEEAFGSDLSSLTAPEKPTSFDLSVFQLNPPLRVGEIVFDDEIQLRWMKSASTADVWI